MLGSEFCQVLGVGAHKSIVVVWCSKARIAVLEWLCVGLCVKDLT